MQTALLLTILTQSFTAIASPLVERATPLSFAESRPQRISYDWTAPYVKDFIIHGSCNATQTNVLHRGLEDAVALAQHAKEHILVHGKKSPIYQKYYGALPTGAVIGWFDTIATANRVGVIFRCDDPDKKCATENRWAGHWRGKEAPSETVICDVSFFERLPLEDLCSRGYTIATGKVYSYWGADLIHRMFHVENVGQNAITHTSHGYQDTLKLAAGQNYTQTATNTDSLIYFAVEAYAFDISVPGEGCAGQAPSVPDTIVIPSTTPNSLPDTIVIPSPKEPEKKDEPEKKAEPEKKPEPEAPGKNCHTHDDGEVHCV